MNIYQKIREENTIKYGTESSRYMKIIIDQYSDRTHFIYEILQNAEDAEARSIKFLLKEDSLEVYHDGRPFNEKDVIGVCGIADGSKTDGTRIGHFGIGFKSVYAYTTTPSIYSDAFCFEIKDHIYPYEIARKSSVKKGETCFILPFNKESVSRQVAHNEIEDALTKKLTAESLIILSNIINVTIEIDNTPIVTKFTIEKTPIKNSNKVFNLLLRTEKSGRLSKSGSSSQSSYILFTDAKKEAVSVIYKISEGKIDRVKNSMIYAFFPTAKESHQNFYIHAPFDTTPARDNLQQGAEYGKHNNVLINHICDLIEYALEWFKDNGYLTLNGINSILPMYEYEESNLLYPLFENSIKLLSSGMEIIPTNIQRVYKSISDICIPESSNIVDVFSDDDLHTLTGEGNCYWVNKNITLGAYSDFYNFLARFDIKTYGWKNLVPQMSSFFLENKDKPWLEQMMSSIESYCIKYSGKKDYINPFGIPFVRLSTRKHICSHHGSVPLVYLNNPEECEYKIDTGLLKSDAIRSFYKNALGLTDFNIESEAIDKILPKYQSECVVFASSDYMAENIKDLKHIKNAIKINPHILEAVKNSYILTDGKKWFKPGDLYIKSDDRYSGISLIENYVNITYIFERYYDSINLDSGFFKSIGCNNGIKPVKVSAQKYIKTVEHYLGKTNTKAIRTILAKEYISDRFDWSISYEAIDKIFGRMTPEKSFEIARVLNRRTQEFVVQGELVGANDQHFSGASVEAVTAYSHIGLLLTYEKWIYTDNSKEPESPINLRREEIDPHYNEIAKRLMDMLPFKELSNALIEYLEENITNPQDRELARKYFAKPDELIKLAKEIAAAEASREKRENKKKKSVLEQIQENEREQLNKDDDLTEPTIFPISKEAKEKREEKLEKAFSESLEHHVKVIRGLSLSNRESNEREKEFLENEYQGNCQICGKHITTYKGEPYFEAINIIKLNKMLDNDVRAIDIGWNSLGLCPNCAAEYNYCSKSISGLYEQVKSKEVIPGSDEPIEIDIEIPKGTSKKIKYSPRHFMAIKAAISFFEKTSNSGINNDDK